MTTENDFFKGKRQWSRIKDKVIGDYLIPYLIKVRKLRKDIVIVDAFAGQGIFDDGCEGSPVIICRTAEKYVPSKYIAIFVNRDKDSHLKLEKSLQAGIKKGSAVAINGNAQDLLKFLTKIVGDATLLVYLDPFGLKGCDFSLLEPYLGRDKRFSTEILINFSIPTLHRLATRKAVQQGKVTTQTKSLNRTLSNILGGEWWKDIMWGKSSAEQKEHKIIETYTKKLNNYLPNAGFCPIREGPGKPVKYYMIFCSRHPDALRLMNDIMCNAYFKTMHKIQYNGTLFEETFSWEDSRTSKKRDLLNLILSIVEKKPGISRKETWDAIIKKKFMRWLRKEFRALVKEMVQDKRIDTKGNRLNDNCPLYLCDNSKNPSKMVQQHAMPKIHRKPYRLVDSKYKILVEKVNDGSIITRFDKTKYPKQQSDVVCPHFLELKWAYGCPYDCSWCYLKGTFRFRPEGPIPIIKDLEKIKLHTNAFLTNCRAPEILNTGEIADSLMGENKENPFSKFIIPMFENQNKHKVLFLTKSPNIKNLLALDSHKQVIISFSVNALPVAKKWEKAPSVLGRLNAAKKLAEADFEVRIRIDPMVPVKNWEKHYIELIDMMFERFRPERITLGSLRGLQSTINGSSDKSWVKYLTESSNWGKKVALDVRYEMYSTIIKHLRKTYKYKNVALCKETIEMWKKLKMDFRKIKCNCVW